MALRACQTATLSCRGHFGQQWRLSKPWTLEGDFFNLQEEGNHQAAPNSKQHQHRQHLQSSAQIHWCSAKASTVQRPRARLSNLKRRGRKRSRRKRQGHYSCKKNLNRLYGQKPSENGFWLCSTHTMACEFFKLLLSLRCHHHCKRSCLLGTNGAQHTTAVLSTYSEPHPKGWDREFKQ